MEFEIGTKIVCINDEHWPAWARAVYNNFPVKGNVYTVRGVIPGIMPTKVIKDETGMNPLQFTGVLHPVVLLDEIVNPVHPAYKNEPGYAAARFAPVEPLKDKKSEKAKNVFTRRQPKKDTAPKRRERELVEA